VRTIRPPDLSPGQPDIGLVNKRRIGLVLLAVTMGLTVLLGASILGLLYWQGSRPVDTSGEYVALGSSFATGIGIGRRAPGSPLQYLRT
jgi:hypothetical protein